MRAKVDFEEIIHRIDMPDGSRIVLLDRAGKRDAYSKEERARNIVFLDVRGRVVWQVSSRFDSDGGPFTRIARENKKLVAYRWDGGMYEIDVGTGEAVPTSLAKQRRSGSGELR